MRRSLQNTQNKGQELYRSTGDYHKNISSNSKYPSRLFFAYISLIFKTRITAVILKRVSFNIKSSSCQNRVWPKTVVWVTLHIPYCTGSTELSEPKPTCTVAPGIRQSAGSPRSCTEQEAPHPRHGLQPRRRGCGEQSPPLWNWMADTSGPGAYTTPPNANFKGQIQTPNRSHSNLSGAVRSLKNTRSPLGDAVRNPHVLKDCKPQRVCSPSYRTTLTGVTELSTQRPQRPAPSTWWGAPPVTALGTSSLSSPPSAAPSLALGWGSPPAAPLFWPPPPCKLGPHPQRPGRFSSGAAVLKPAPQPGREGSTSVPRQGSSESPDSKSPTKPASPGPHILSRSVPAARLARLSHVCKQ